MSRLSFNELYESYSHAITAIDTLDELNNWQQINLRAGLFRDNEAAEAQYRALIRVVARRFMSRASPDEQEDILIAELYEADLRELGPEWEYAVYTKEFAELKARAQEAVKRSEDY